MAGERERTVRDLLDWLATTSFAERYMIANAISLWAGLSPPWPLPPPPPSKGEETCPELEPCRACGTLVHPDNVTTHCAGRVGRTT